VKRRDVHAHHADHLAVIGRGADQPAELRAGEQEPERERHQRAEREHEQVVGGEVPAPDVHRPGEDRRTRHRPVVGTPDELDGVADDEHERVRDEELLQLLPAVDGTEERRLHERAHDGHARRGQHERDPERGGGADEERGDRVAQVGAQHVERAVGEVEHAHDAEDQGEARGDEEQEHRRVSLFQALNGEERRRRGDEIEHRSRPRLGYF
jgi:hypothetical protein